MYLTTSIAIHCERGENKQTVFGPLSIFYLQGTRSKHKLSKCGMPMLEPFNHRCPNLKHYRGFVVEIILSLCSQSCTCATLNG
jgi:hypothetical protein